MAKRMTKRFLTAFNNHERSKRELQKAANDIERFTTCLFVALKYQERTVEKYNKTAKALVKARGGS